MAVIADPDTAIAAIAKAHCIGLGGSVNAGHPMALVRALIRARPSNLTVVALTGGLDVDLLIAAGVVRAVSAAYVGSEDVIGLPPALRWAAEEGRLDVWESEEGIHLASLRARAQRLPFATWTGALGTAPAAHHPLVEEAVDDKTRLPYLKVRPLQVDAALLWAEAADEEGNVLMWGTDFGDEALRHAADTRIVQVERIVPASVLARNPDRVAPWSADIVVRAPLSTHPFGSSAIAADKEWLRAYAAVVIAARKAKDRADLDAFLDEWIRGVGDEDAYLAKVGVQRLRQLMT